MPDREEKKAVCAICCKAHSVSEMSKFCGKLLCPSCLTAYTFVCACCRKRVPYSEIATWDDDDIQLCQDCYDQHFTRCDACGLLLNQKDARWRMLGGYERPYCDECYLERWGNPFDGEINQT